ncbi:MAG: hypothetical protein CVU05_14255 [Bacteroidetes bacterium HGW-Bacteroidetes-21]|jgi:hypothetical protein|nr:MAG: hypothetical protein CVU05_14255 [Bacteroidetes bacterium HGW-Bacteroidetes-21]
MLSIKGNIMAKYVFTYNQKKEARKRETAYTPAQMRDEAIRFLLLNGVDNLEQCLDTTFCFDSDLSVADWRRLIENKLRPYIEAGYYLIARVALGKNGLFWFRACNPELQERVETIKAEYR